MRRSLLAVAVLAAAGCATAPRPTPLGSPPPEAELKEALALLDRTCAEGTMRQATGSEGGKALTRALWFVERACEYETPEACAFLAAHVRMPVEDEEALAVSGTPMSIDREVKEHRQTHGAGQLLVHARISPEGRVLEPRALQQENPRAEWATTEVARRVFHPGTLCGEPVAFHHLFVLEFPAERVARVPVPTAPRR